MNLRALRQMVVARGLSDATIALQRSEARLRAAERMIGVGCWERTLSNDIVTYSEGFAQVTGLPAGGGVPHRMFREIVHDEDQAIVDAALRECLAAGQASCEYRIVRPDGAKRIVALLAERVDGPGGSPTHVRGALLDITDQRASEEARLEALTLFRQGFDEAPIAMTLCDAANGRYVRVNDAMCRMLGRSREELLELDVAALTHPDERAGTAEAMQALRSGAISAWETEKRYARPDGSSVWATVHVTPVRRSDGSISAFFSQKVDITERRRREIELERSGADAVWLRRIRDALDEDRLVLYWQPIVELRTGRTARRELLLRMRDPDGSVVAPNRFLPVAERYGLMGEIDRWVIRHAVAAAAADGMPTQFNVSATSIGRQDVINELAAAIRRTGVDPFLLVVEVTETSIVDQPLLARRFSEQVHELGCSLALDDFGTGFGCLSHLKHIPAEQLKIDLEFVRQMRHSATDQRLVRGIVALAREFDQHTTAEGVEDIDTLALLRELDVDCAQGYLFGRPEPLRPPGQAVESQCPHRALITDRG